ncbi:MAG: ABC transporter permease, partial [Vicinamibacteraceae bacterium]
AFTLILLIGAGLLVQTLARLHTKGPGFDSSRLVMFYVNPLESGYTESEATQVIRDLLTTLQDLPVVERAAVAAEEQPTGGSWNANLTIQFQGRFVTESVVDLNWVSPGLFSTFGTRVIAGRDFNERDALDSESDTGNFPARSVIVNQRFARRYFGNHSPIGHRLGFGNRPDTPANIEIVGVVDDFSYRGLREQTEQAFFPFWEGQEGNPGVFYLKVRAEPTFTFAAIREAVGQVVPTLPVSLRTIEDEIDRSLTTERMLATLSSGFGAIALLLSVVGLYGVMSFVVTCRTQEIGVRMALGATRSAAVWLIVRDAVVMIGAGTAMALPCVWVLSRLVEAQLFGVRAVDGPTIAIANGILALVAVGAAMLPAWRGASVSPTEALRLE